MRTLTLKGFSLIEMVVAMSILIMIVTLTAALEERALRVQQVEIAAELLRVELVEARGAAMANTHDGRWGVHIEDGSLNEFHGDSYMARDTAWDKSYTYESYVSVSGTRDYVFEKISGYPLVAGETIFSDSGRSYRVSVNRYGAIAVQ